MSQKDDVLRHFKRYGKLTQLQAFTKYRIFRLAHIVWVLRNDYLIHTIPTTRNGKTFATYVYDGELK